MNNLRKILLSLVLCSFFLILHAQNVNVSGIVVDNHGDAIIGATVLQKGTHNATITDLDGLFKLIAPINSKLEITYVGFDKVVVNVKSSMRIVLKELNSQLNEVVVIGYGTVRKKDLTGSVIQIRPEKLANQNPLTVQDVLRGAAGVNVGYDASANGGGRFFRSCSREGCRPALPTGCSSGDLQERTGMHRVSTPSFVI